MSAEVTRLIPEPLTAEAFSPFGDVIEVSDANNHFTINQGFTERYHDLANIDVDTDDGRAIVSIFRATPLGLPISIQMMERHPKGSQAFMPLSNEPYLVVVAPSGKLDLSKIKVFKATSSQGVNYHKGTWHHFCLALNQVSDFLVIDRAGSGDNCDIVDLDGSLVVELTD